MPNEASASRSINSEEPSKGARSRSADDTRAKLLVAASELFASKGYRQTTIDQIAKRAGVAKGTFFVHFAAKEAAVAALIRTQVKSAIRERDKIASAQGTAIARVRASILTLGQIAGASRGLCRAVLAASLESQEVGGAAEALFGELHASLVDDVKAGQKEGLFVHDAEPKRVASALMAAYLGSCLHFASSPHAGDLIDVLAPLLDTHLASFSV